MFVGYKCRIYPNKAQAQRIENHLGAVRWIYNWGLDQKIKAYQIEGMKLSKYELQRMLPLLKQKEETKVEIR